MIKYRRQIIILISWMAVLLWMLLIFNLSSQVAEQSDKLSTGIVELIIKMVQKVTHNTEFDIKSLNHIIRKNAHFLAYFVLGVLTVNALKRSRVKGLKAGAFAMGICVLYAVSDEVHQIFVPGRGPGIKDVFIDSAGAAIGIGVYMLISKALMKKYKMFKTPQNDII